MTSFEDKKIIIAGGGQGIGAATGRKLAAAGAHVELWDIAEEAGAALASSLRLAGGTADYRNVNVFDYEETEAAVERFTAEHGRLDGLMCTVGGGLQGPILDVDGAFFEKQIRLNLLSVFNCGRAAVAPMAAQKAGRLLFFTSTTGGLPGMAGYGAGKAGVESLVKSFHAELGPLGIGTNAIMPNLVATEMTKRFYRDNNLEHVMDQMAQSMPFGVGTPEEVADVAVYLLSDEARRVSNSIINLL